MVGMANATMLARSVVGLGSLLGCSACAEGVVVLDEREQVAVDQLPLRVALSYVERHPDAVFRDPDAAVLDSSPSSGADAELDRHLAGDWVARMTLAYDAEGGADRVQWARRSVQLTRATLFSQREINLEMKECICEEGFADGAFVRLVRGFGNCESNNHVLAMLLRVNEPGVLLYNLDDAPDGTRGGHTLAAISGSHGGRIFVDAWADFDMFVLDEASSAEVPTWAELRETYEPGFGGLYEAIQYELAWPKPNVELDYGPRTEMEPDLSIPDDLPAAKDARGAYLRARVFHLYGLEHEALELYELARSMACHEPEAALCQLSTAWSERTSAE